MNIIYIGLGGFVGAVARYLISRFISNYVSSFPLGTLAVNVIGSLLIGFVLYSVSLGRNISSDLRDFITIGMIGGFTTMSGFAYESFRLMELNEFMYFGLNVVLNIVLCLAAVYAGKELAVLITK